MRLRMRGFNIVELMVAMVAGLLLVAAVTSLFATILKANQTAMQTSRLNQELQGITDMIARDVQRAGYDASAATSTRLASGASPSDFYFNTSTALASGCIVVSYDGRDEENQPSSANGTGDDKESVVYSYRADRSVWMVELSPPVSTPVSTLLACDDGGNRISTNDIIDISDLTFSLLGSSVSSGARTVRLSITGQHKANNALKLTLQRDIKLRNDGY